MATRNKPIKPAAAKKAPPATPKKEQPAAPQAPDTATALPPQGEVKGPGTPTSDSISARLSTDEYVLPDQTINALGAMLKQMAPHQLGVMLLDILRQQTGAANPAEETGEPTAMQSPAEEGAEGEPTGLPGPGEAQGNTPKFANGGTPSSLTPLDWITSLISGSKFSQALRAPQAQADQAQGYQAQQAPQPQQTTSMGGASLNDIDARIRDARSQQTPYASYADGGATIGGLPAPGISGDELQNSQQFYGGGDTSGGMVGVGARTFAGRAQQIEDAVNGAQATAPTVQPQPVTALPPAPLPQEQRQPQGKVMSEAAKAKMHALGVPGFASGGSTNNPFDYPDVLPEQSGRPSQSRAVQGAQTTHTGMGGGIPVATPNDPNSAWSKFWNPTSNTPSRQGGNLQQVAIPPAQPDVNAGALPAANASTSIPAQANPTPSLQPKPQQQPPGAIMRQGNSFSNLPGAPGQPYTPGNTLTVANWTSPQLPSGLPMQGYGADQNIPFGSNVSPTGQDLTRANQMMAAANQMAAQRQQAPAPFTYITPSGNVIDERGAVVGGSGGFGILDNAYQAQRVNQMAMGRMTPYQQENYVDLLKAQGQQQAEAGKLGAEQQRNLAQQQQFGQEYGLKAAALPGAIQGQQLANLGAMGNLQQHQQLLDLQRQMMTEQDPIKQRQLMMQLSAMTGKSPADRYIVVPGGQALNEYGTPYTMASKLYDVYTGQEVTGAQQPQQGQPQMQGKQQQYPDNTVLVDKNGKRVIIQNGHPVPYNG